MGSKFKAIVNPKDVQRCLTSVKDALDIGLGVKGSKNVDGHYWDKWVTYRELEDFILNNSLIADAISYSVSVSYGFNDPVDVTLVSDVLNVTGSGMVTVSAETGTTDDLTQISGLSKGDTIYLLAASGHTLTLTASAYIKLPSPTWILSGYRIATFDCLGGGICAMRSHEANRT